jgi:HD-GYP domain-containing protein (c-di-GMP phosphodiesterase class II)
MPRDSVSGVVFLGDDVGPDFSRLMDPLTRRMRGEFRKGPTRFLVEHIAPVQLRDSAFVRRLTRWWDDRHGLANIDALLILGLENPRLIDWIRLDVSREIPIVFYANGPLALTIARSADSIPRVFGVTNDDPLAQVIATLPRILPQTERLVAIVDRAEEGERLAQLARSASSRIASFEVMERPTPADIIERGKALPPNTAFLFTEIFFDRTGQVWKPDDFLDAWATQVDRPILVSDRRYLRPGVLGAVVSSPEVIGEEIGSRLATVLAGAVPDTAPLKVIRRYPAVWRFPALRQFSIDLDSLPPDSEVLEIELSVWQRYPRGSVAIVSFIVALLGLVGLLTRFNRLSRQRNRALRAAKVQTARAMASMAEWRDPETGEHIRRTQFYVKLLAEGLRELPHHRTTLTHEVIDLIYESAPLHDIGKVAIRDSILLKPGKLTPEEFAEMQRHVTIGRQMLDRVQLADEESTPFMDFAKQIAQSHHEKWDGTGYPEQLAGEAIPLAARLMALADVYDALRSERPYKAPLPHPEVERIIVSERGRHFDPEIVDVFLRSREQFIEIADRYKDQPTTPP